ncbi:MAG TPA: hypothetical protein VGJ03_00315 [Acidimicrobiales bacterium]|jgi:hypothetical protein
MGLRTEYEFVLPRGYVDDDGEVHRRGVMRLATARDELEPLRSATVTGPDDPRVTILVLARVVRTLGTLELVTPQDIEGLFAADLAYLQDFYGIINFGSEADINALLEAQRQADQAERAASVDPEPAPQGAPVAQAGDAPAEAGGRRAGRRAAIEEVPAAGR